MVTNDDDVAEQVHCSATTAATREGRVVAWGFNSRLDNLQAALLNHKLASFGEEIERRRAIARMYQAGLGELPSCAPAARRAT